MIEVYFLDTSCFQKKDVFDKYYKDVSLYRKEKIDRYNFNKDKILSLGAGVLIDTFLKSKGYREKEMIYAENDYGKPYFENLPKLYFNVSHSIDKVMVCFSDSEIGCDIQKTGDVNLDIAKRFFTDKEFSFLHGYDKTSACEYFYKIWTMKESFTKMIGTGLKTPLNSFEVDCTEKDLSLLYQNQKYFFYEVNSFSGYKSCVCSNINQELKVYRLKEEDL